MKTALRKRHPLTLGFSDEAVEAAYRQSVLPRLRWHGRVAMLLGMVVYCLFAVLDSYHVPPGQVATLWAVRGAMGVVVLLAVAWTWHPRFTARQAWWLLAGVGLAGGLSLLVLFGLQSPRAVTMYYGGLVLTTFYIYNFVGTRFVLALAANVALAVGYNLMFGVWRPVPDESWISHNLHLLSANILGGTAAYFAEYQSRRLFLVEHGLKLDRDQLLHDALHDPLTELPNRVLLVDRIEQALTQSRRTGTGGVVLFVDLDGFKAVNDTHGHEAGDRVLREAARRMRACVRESDTLSRIGGDEFVLLSMGVTQEAQLAALSDKLLQVLETPYAVYSQHQGQPAVVRISASIGASFFPDDGCEAHELIRRSDEAMYRSKREGELYAVWSEAA